MLKLTEREKLVFYGMVRWPNLTDAQLAERLNVGRSTVTTIRNRLESNRLYTTINAPDFNRIGCEILTALYGEFSPSAMCRRVSGDIADEFDNIFFMVSMGMHKVSLGASATFTEIKKHIEDYHEGHHKIGLSSEKRHNYVLFPLKLSRIFRFFDYAPLLKDHFNIEIEDGPVANESYRTVRLTHNEKLVFHSMIKHPELTDGKIASKVDMTRQTVSSIRKKIEENRLVRRIRIPDVGKLGFELLTFTHLHINPKTPITHRTKGIEMLLNSPPHIMKVSGNLESIILSVFKDYTDYLNTHSRVFDFYRENNFLLEDPIVKIFSTREADLEIHHRYAPLVENVLMSTE